LRKRYLWEIGIGIRSGKYHYPKEIEKDLGLNAQPDIIR
jgi:hypothetical protein